MPNVYITKYYNKDAKKVSVKGRAVYDVNFKIDENSCYYGEARITRVPARNAGEALQKASEMVTDALPGVSILEVEYAKR